MNKVNPSKIYITSFLSLIIVCFIFLIYPILKSSIPNLSLIDVLSFRTLNLHANFSELNIPVLGESLTRWCLHFFPITLVITIVLCLPEIFKNPKQSAYLIFRSVLIGFICFYICLQSFLTMAHAVKFNKFLEGKSLFERQANYYEKAANLSKDIHKILPGTHTGRLITDLDVSKDPGMLDGRALAYFLYPIDIRGIQQGPVNVLVYFEKANALDFVPKNFQIIKQLDQNNLIAVKVK